VPQDTAKYRPVVCYQCGETLLAYTFKDVWDMRIDNVMHKVPIYSVPCYRCDACDIAITDGGSDEAISWAYKKYLNDNNLNTPWLRFRRMLRRNWNRLVWRIQYRFRPKT